MNTLADRIIHFNKTVFFKGVLPAGISIMNPYRESEEALRCSSLFFKKYYSDNNERRFIIGINPGRFGSGLTGVSFTDPKKLEEKCGISTILPRTHEPSSEFIYRMIDAYGGVEKFYAQFYINSVCPLGFTQTNEKGKEVNYNYYDSKELTDAVYDYMIENIKTQISFGISTDLCFCFGTGKNEKVLNKINDKHQFFKRVIALEHPRFIMQYKFKTKELYIDKYLNAFNEIK